MKCIKCKKDVVKHRMIDAERCLKALYPDFNVNIIAIDEMISFAHAKGVLTGWSQTPGTGWHLTFKNHSVDTLFPSYEISLELLAKAPSAIPEKIEDEDDEQYDPEFAKALAHDSEDANLDLYDVDLVPPDK